MTSYILLLISYQDITTTVPIRVGGRTYESLGFPELKQDTIHQTAQEFWETVLYDVRTAWQMWITSTAITIEGKTFTLPDVLKNAKTLTIIINDDGDIMECPIKQIKEWGGHGAKIIYFEGDEYKTSKSKWGMPFLKMTWKEIDTMVRMAFMLIEETFTLRRTVEKYAVGKESTILGMTNQINVPNVKARRELAGGYEGIEGEGAIYRVDDDGAVYVWIHDKKIPSTYIPETQYWLEPLTYTRILESGKEIEVTRDEAVLVDKDGYMRKEFTTKGYWMQVGSMNGTDTSSGDYVSLTPAEFLEIVQPPVEGKGIGGLNFIKNSDISRKKGNTYTIVDSNGKDQFLIVEIGDLELEDIDLAFLSTLLFRDI